MDIRISWRGYLFSTLASILLAFAVFDEPLGLSRQDLSPVVLIYGAFASGFGNSAWIIVGALAALLLALVAWRLAVRRRPRAQALILAQSAVFFLITIVGSGITVNLIKRVIGRARPSEFIHHGIFSFEPFSFNAHFASFPSGHATTVGAFFAALSFFLPRYRLAFFIAAAWLAVGRVIVGAHYPSDVVAGLAYGGWFSYAVAILFARRRLLFRLNDGGFPVPRPGLRILRFNLSRPASSRSVKTYLDLGAQRGH
ncbi:phosphatase PAP2 family protein [Martelella alba]|uniref:phosphatase PAP2 family protein n=1 Tax=Martelella alba TaxID=2590451 RepID=UPI0015E8365B|nr:phosphatase PAP2 family protein [Martelella alba]